MPTVASRNIFEKYFFWKSITRKMAAGSNQPWNDFTLPPPPLITIECDPSMIDLDAIRQVLEQSILFYESQNDLEHSAALCSRLLARRKNSFRSLRGYQDLCKVNSALCRLLRLDIVSVLRTFDGSVPFFKKIKGKFTLPARKNFDYMMLRMIALHKLHSRIIEYCLKSARFFFNLMSQYYFFEISTLFVCVIAKIWKNCRKSFTETATFYTRLFEYRRQFPAEKDEPFYKNFTFPRELVEPDEKVEDTIVQKLHEYAEKTETLSNLLQSAEDKASGPKIMMKQNNVDQENTIIAVPFTSSSCLGLSASTARSTSVDLGVVVSRDSLDNLDETLDNLKTLEQIQVFARKETKRRKKEKHVLTKRITKKTWKLFRGRLAELQTGDNRSAVKLLRSLLTSTMKK